MASEGEQTPLKGDEKEEEEEEEEIDGHDEQELLDELLERNGYGCFHVFLLLGT